MKKPQTASGDGVFAKGDKVTPELMNSMYAEFGSILAASGLDFDETKSNQLLEAIGKQVASKTVTRTIRATLSGGIFETSTRVPWYPPEDANTIKSVRLQVASTPPVPVVVSIDIAGTKTQYTLPSGELTKLFAVDLNIKGQPAVNVAVETAGGENLIITMDYV